MIKEFILFIIILCLLLSGCASSYKVCKADCYSLYRDNNCTVPIEDFFDEGWCTDNEVKKLKQYCFDECKGKL